MRAKHEENKLRGAIEAVSNCSEGSSASILTPRKTADFQEAIIKFLERMVDCTADKMPDTVEKNFHFSGKGMFSRCLSRSMPFSTKRHLPSS